MQAQLNDVTLAEAHNYLRERLLLDMDVPRLSALKGLFWLPFEGLATDDQASAIRAFMCGRDVFVMLPTVSEKSLALPMLFGNLADSNTKLHSSIVVVVSPLRKTRSRNTVGLAYYDVRMFERE